MNDISQINLLDETLPREYAADNDLSSPSTLSDTYIMPNYRQSLDISLFGANWSRELDLRTFESSSMNPIHWASRLVTKRLHITNANDTAATTSFNATVIPGHFNSEQELAEINCLQEQMHLSNLTNSMNIEAQTNSLDTEGPTTVTSRKVELSQKAGELVLFSPVKRYTSS